MSKGAIECPKGHCFLPDDDVPDKLLIRRAAEGIEFIAAHMKSTGHLGSRLMPHDLINCGTVLAELASMPDSMVRLRMQTVSSQYPTTARLHKMFPQ
jgi:hypothetical protein